MDVRATSRSPGQPRQRPVNEPQSRDTTGPSLQRDARATEGQAATEVRKAELVTQANQTAALMASWSEDLVVAHLEEDSSAVATYEGLLSGGAERYRDQYQELERMGTVYHPPELLEADAKAIANKALMRKWQARLDKADGNLVQTIKAEIQNDAEALAIGLERGVKSLWSNLKAFLRNPVEGTKNFFVDLASTIIHPIRNFSRAQQAYFRFRDKHRYEKLLTLGEELPQALATNPITYTRSVVRDSEMDGRAAIARLISERGADAPQGKSHIGTAVNRAVWGMRNGPVSPEQAISRGVVDEIWFNDPDAHDEAISKLSELIRTDAKEEVSLQTYIFDFNSDAAKELLETLAQKQRENPNFRVNFIYDRDKMPWSTGMKAALKRHGVHAEVAATRPMTSRRGHHTKMAVIDGRIGIIGGNNIDNAKETDITIKVRGSVVKAMLEDFDDAWRHGVYYINGDATPPEHPKDRGPEPDNAVPITVLGKRGTLGWNEKEHYDNDANQGLLAAIAASRREIKIASPNLNDDQVIEALRHAAERGVKVKVMVPFDYQAIASQIDRAANRALLVFWAELPPEVRANVEMRNFSTDGKTGERHHGKYLSVDGVWAYVGSQNFDNQAFQYSRELGLGIDDAEQAKRLDAEVFDRQWHTSLPVEPSWFERIIPHSFYTR